MCKFSPKVKWSVIISKKAGVYEFSHELPKNIKLTMSGNSQNFREILPSAQSSSRNENFVSASKNLMKNKHLTFSVACYFTWKLQLALDFLWMFGGSVFINNVKRARWFSVLSFKKHSSYSVIWKIKSYSIKVISIDMFNLFTIDNDIRP